MTRSSDATRNTCFDPRDWDLVVEGPVSGVLEVLLHEPGRYMILVLASMSAYEAKASATLDVELSVDWERDGWGLLAEPTDVSLRVVTPGGRDAAFVRVALGRFEGTTDAAGRLMLRGVQPGFYTLKLGRDGSLRGGSVFDTTTGGAVLIDRVVVSSFDRPRLLVLMSDTIYDCISGGSDYDRVAGRCLQADGSAE